MTSKQTGNTKLLIIVILVAVVVVLGVGGAAGWMLLRGGGVSQSLKEASPVVANPVFLKLDPFTVNVQGGQGGGMLLYAGITLELGDKATLGFITEYMPQVRNRLLMVLSDQTAATLTTSDGKHQLAELIRAALTKPFTKNQPQLEINNVLFTQFIVQ